jgi:hypothetical protein
MRRECAIRVRWALLGASICLLLSLVTGAAKAPDRGTTPGVRQLMMGLPVASDEQEARAKVAATRVNCRMADTSLAVREQVDFLLTPALLVQEAVSEDVILTYPEE